MPSEKYRLAGHAWAKLDAAASLLEESKSAVLSQMINKNLHLGPGQVAFNRAEMLAKASPEWLEYIDKMVKAREEANLAKVNLEFQRMRYGEQQSAEATARAESRL